MEKISAPGVRGGSSAAFRSGVDPAFSGNCMCLGPALSSTEKIGVIARLDQGGIFAADKGSTDFGGEEKTLGVLD